MEEQYNQAWEHLSDKLHSETRTPIQNHFSTFYLLNPFGQSDLGCSEGRLALKVIRSTLRNANSGLEQPRIVSQTSLILQFMDLRHSFMQV